MEDLKESRFMYVSDGWGFCDCCEEDKQLLLIVSVAATLSICLDCLPAVTKGIADKQQELQARKGRTH